MPFTIHKEPTDTWSGDDAIHYAQQFNFTPEELDAHWVKEFGCTRTSIYNKFLPKDKGANILEVGCNCANQIVMLNGLGYALTTGVEIGKEAVAIARKRNENHDIIQGDATEGLPFNDNSHDLVMTCACLSHIPPDKVQAVVTELRRVSKHQVLISEYTAGDMQNFCWLHDYNKLFGDALKLDEESVPNGKIVTQLWMP